MITIDHYQTLDIQKLHHINKTVTVSGISSGAYMAGQFHLSHSNLVSGAALFAGGPYYCSQNNVMKAMKLCMEEQNLTIDTDDLLGEIKDLEDRGLIDPISNLNNDKVLIINGKRDHTVRERVSHSAANLYKMLGVKKVEFNNKLDIAHTFPTLSKGNECQSDSSSPFISACNIDGAKMALKKFYNLKSGRSEAQMDRFFQMDQWALTPSSFYFMARHATAYVPKACETKSCNLHVSFHGCKQTRLDIGDQFFKEVGLAEWAEKNNIVVLFPQTLPNFIGLSNPNGCWDWWGYSGPNFHNKLGPQIKSVYNLVLELISNTK
ncbi:hypothetical protein [Bacteriovorax sp. Seq25_V]|uniref:extracellular catalytic domain type 2 short-chain-length polyhydroxyalkanoate depolymerase n=1 Tax=Bacteriovorax sp. Seq25_V TaxID=1201288 RepID=UPI00038A1F55|nr:hypothetical protein [Bacteriovorax sp. Seq25_V]EQC47185.1 hypothetical protein M900_0587 [Bacteriovorax sp. Seq25_V]